MAIVDDLFSRRMNNLYTSPSNIEDTLGRKTVRDSIAVEEITFTHDPNIKRGMIYDWGMNEIEEVDFKFQKNKSYTLSSDEVEYHVQFRTGFNPEKKYKDLYFRDDGRERVGFYLDIEDEQSGIMEKWLVLGKDDKNYFDRYLALKCNWMFEWIDKKNGGYYSQLGVLRDRNNYNSGVWSDGITTTVQNQIAFILPSNAKTETINYEIRFMLSDNIIYPKVYEITKIMDTFPLGVTKYVLSQCYYNEHTDFAGLLDNVKNLPTNIDLDLIDDLPDGFGGKYHLICDLIKSKIPIVNDNVVDTGAENDQSWHLSSTGKNLVINGNKNIIRAVCGNKDAVFSGDWKIFVDNNQYSVEDLSPYFDIKINENEFSIFAKNKIMATYVVRVEISDSSGQRIDSVEMEVIV